MAQNSTSGGSTGSQNVTETVSETVQQVTGQAKEQVGQVKEQVAQKATSRVDEQKVRAAQSLGSVASAFTQVGDQMRYENPTVAQVADTVAQRLQTFSDDISTQDVSEIVHRVERFARNQPAMFFGAAFALGFAGARFLKSSAPEGSGRGNYGSGYGSTGNYPGVYGGYGAGQSRDYITGYGTDYGVTGYGAPQQPYGSTGHGSSGVDATGSTGSVGATGTAGSGSTWGTAAGTSETAYGSSLGTAESSRSGQTAEHQTVSRTSYSPYDTTGGTDSPTTER